MEIPTFILSAANAGAVATTPATASATTHHLLHEPRHVSSFCWGLAVLKNIKTLESVRQQFSGIEDVQWIECGLDRAHGGELSRRARQRQHLQFLRANAVFRRYRAAHLSRHAVH